MDESTNNLPKCRACLANALEYVDLETPLFLYEGEGFEQTFTYLECFNQCTQLTATMEDDYSKYLCTSCGFELKNAYEFIAKARQSHEALQSSCLNDVKSLLDKVDDHADVDAVAESKEDLHLDDMITIKKEQNDDAHLQLKLEMITESIGHDTIECNFEEDFVINELSNSLSCEANDVHSKSETSVSIIMGNEVSDGEDLKFDIQNEEEKYPNFGQLNEEEYEQENDPENDDFDFGRKSNYLDYRCEICSEKFRFQKLLEEHYSTMHTEFILHYECDSCDNRFFSKRALNMHIKKIHLNVEYVDCHICGRTVLKTWYEKHMQKQHEKVREFLCSACPRIFKNHTSLKKHMETHQTDRERKFQCTECDKKFFTIENFRVHQAIHVEPSERKPFQCSLCDKTFLRNTNLKLHMQMHRGETMDCSHCSKKFVRKKDLEIHIRFHTGDYPFKCNLCDKRYAIKGHLNYHKKRHFGVKYRCSLCTKEFINLSGLRQHSYEHTGMPLFCMVCQKGFPSRFKVKRHLKSVHHIEDTGNILERFISVRKENTEKRASLKKCEVSQKDEEEEGVEEVYEEIFLMDEEDT